MMPLKKQVVSPLDWSPMIRLGHQVWNLLFFETKNLFQTTVSVVLPLKVTLIKFRCVTHIVKSQLVSFWIISTALISHWN